MKKNYIKLNTNDDHLSIGNLCRIIKDLSINKASALQSELFCTLFNLETVNDTTINNYCIGCRAINNDYKQIYLTYQKKFAIDKNVLLNTIFNLVIILEGQIINIDNQSEKLEFINKNSLFIKLCLKLYNISKNDSQVSKELSASILNFIEHSNYYEAFISMLFFIILEKRQPISNDDLRKENIESLLNSSDIPASELTSFLNLTFRNSTNYNYYLKQLAANKNTYACYELGTQEFYGYYTGFPRYDKAFEYLKIAAEAKHPGAAYMIGVMFLNGKIGSGQNAELELAYDYFQKAIKYGNIEALNAIGRMYLARYSSIT